MILKRLRVTALATAFVAAGLFATACGGDDNNGSTGDGDTKADTSKPGEVSFNEPLKCDKQMSVQEMLDYEVPKADKEYDIAQLQVQLGAYYFQAMAYGGEKAAKEAGANFTLKAGQGYESPSFQLDQAQTLLAQPLDAIVLQPTDIEGSVSVVDQATANDVPVVDISTEVNSPDAYVVMQDDYLQGVAAADAIAEAFPDGGQGIVQGGPGNATWARKRVAGFQDQLKEKYPKLKINAVTQEDVDPQEGLEKFMDAVQEHPQVDWIYAVNTALLLPVSIPAQYKDALYFGGGLEPMILDGLKSGTVAGAIPADQVAMGYIGVGNAVSILNGEDVPRVTCMPVEVVTKDDLGSDFVEGELYPADWKVPGG